MSAKLTRHVLFLTLTPIAWLCSTPALRAATPATSSATAASSAPAVALKPMTREEAELMLKQARSAIAEGRLDEADKMLTRVENAHVNFSVFHVGPNPATVRRELTRAKIAAKTGNNGIAQDAAAAGKTRSPFTRPGTSQSKPVIDPFAATSNATPPSNAETANRAVSTRSRTLAPISAPGETSPATTPAISHTASDPRYPVVQASAESNPFAAPAASGSSRSPAATATTDNPYAVNEAANVPLGQDQGAVDAPAQSKSLEGAASRPPAKSLAKAKLAEARQALAKGGLDLAEVLTQSANAMGVPESQYLPDEDRPSIVAWEIAQAKQKQQGATAKSPAIARLPATTASRYQAPATQQADAAVAAAPPNTNDSPAGYRLDGNHPAEEPMPLAIPAASSQVASAPATSFALPNDASAVADATAAASPNPQMLAAAEPSANPSAETPALPAAKPPAAPPTIENLPAPATRPKSAKPLAAAAAPADLPVKNKTSLIDTADAKQQVLARQLSAEVGKRQSEAQRLLEKDPERAIATLHEAQQLVKDSKLPESTQRELLSRIQITLGKTEQYSKDHKSEIDLDKHNQAVLADVNRDREMKLKMKQKIAEMLNEFNRLRDEQRFAEMEIIARRMNEMAPDDPVVQQVWQNAKFIRREMMNRQLADNKENSYWEQMYSTESSAVNPVAKDGHELAYNEKTWNEIAKNRKGSKERLERRTPRELEIEQKLKSPVLLKYENTPLSEVVSGLSELAGVNIHLDPRGLTQEGVNTDTPVTITLTKEVTLKSALNLILEPLHLSYVINDEVLKITSEQLRDGQLITKPYNVADLVTPIPNFVPSSNMGLQGLINDSMAAAGQGKIGFGSTGPTVLVNDRHSKAAGANGNVLAQQFNAAAPTNGSPSSAVPIGAGPGGMGGAANADFDSLIDLIVSTVETDTWAENGGGQAEIRPFPTNLSLVISQTQAVHEEIADLLQQLRKLQDLQVTIEVRFIRLNDRFFERIGIDFDMNIKDVGVNADNADQFQPNNATGHSNTVGLLPAAGTNTFPNFTSDLSVPFRQGSFDSALPPAFSGFDPNTAATMGFAILSDIEAYFLIQAAQGDARTNVLNAPKVTLFNGQQAFVADTTQRPFVVGVIPVVGEFAAAQQPVIVVLNEGTMMTIQAVVSDDRRYVRMTIVPFFTQIGNVDTFTFEGSTSSTSSSSATDNNNDGKNESKDTSDAKATSGVTVQLPSFSFVSVVTTVSVPDGGTVLLGGIKRLSEGRNEFGVPLLSKVPYINRLFRNVGIGRETDSLMMMVTPRIIIQEEEEERLGVPPTGG